MRASTQGRKTCNCPLLLPKITFRSQNAKMVDFVWQFTKRYILYILTKIGQKLMNFILKCLPYEVSYSSVYDIIIRI